MCGRYTIAKPERLVAALKPDTVTADLSRPRYNVAPMQKAPAMSVRDGKRVLADYQWGFVPEWAKDPSIGNRMINARAESVAVKPSFQSSFRSRRCLIPADGFYEWQKTDSGKQPVYVCIDDEMPFAFAGLYSILVTPGALLVTPGALPVTPGALPVTPPALPVTPPASWNHESEQSDLHGGRGVAGLFSCVIITTHANEFMRPVHDRMPVILPQDAWEQWMDPRLTDMEILKGMLCPFDGKRMRIRTVSKLVNSSANDDERCIAEQH